jgi:hypothetical protein
MQHKFFLINLTRFIQANNFILPLRIYRKNHINEEFSLNFLIILPILMSQECQAGKADNYSV